MDVDLELLRRVFKDAREELESLIVHAREAGLDVDGIEDSLDELDPMELAEVSL